jgi:hypothetical protein
VVSCVMCVCVCVCVVCGAAPMAERKEVIDKLAQYVARYERSHHLPPPPPLSRLAALPLRLSPDRLARSRSRLILRSALHPCRNGRPYHDRGLGPAAPI